MKKGERAPTDAAVLRRRAEARLKKSAASAEVGKTAPGDAQRLVHELQVHQIELELQNEELERARGELEAGLQSYSELYDFAPVGYFTLGREGEIRKANLTGSRLLKVERSRLVGGRFGRFVAAGSRPVFNAFLKKVFGSRAKEACDVVLQVEGGEPLSVHIEAAASEEEQDCRAVLMDISELKRVEGALQEADRRRNDFLAVLSHELRNPLTPIMNSLYILEHAVPGGDQGRRAQAVIGRQTAQLARLVDDLLDVTRVTRNKIELHRQRLELNELVRRTLEDHRPQFEKSEVVLELTPAAAPVYVLADWNRLAQVIGNLLQNAAKFTGRKGAARVSVTTDYPARRAVVRIADTGVGMAPEMLSRVFEPFSQADGTLDRSKGGLGLGLALVKGLVELHGGEVSAHSEGLGKGTELTVRLPLDLADVGVPLTSSEELERRPRRVLVIEDNIDAADSLSEALALDGHEVAVAYNGQEGIEKARQLRPEVVLCDIGLPGMDGYEVARAFRRDAVLRSTYLVALSGYALPEDLQRASDAGFDRHLAKPPLLEKLEEMLATVPQWEPSTPAIDQPPP
jgi:signal transduction histidine kinase/ActR/RegA family two-component response regulator